MEWICSVQTSNGRRSGGKGNQAGTYAGQTTRDDPRSRFTGVPIDMAIAAVGGGNRFVPGIAGQDEDQYAILQLPRNAGVAKHVGAQMLGAERGDSGAVPLEQVLGIRAPPECLLSEGSEIPPCQPLQSAQRRLPCLPVEVGRGDRGVVDRVKQQFFARARQVQPIKRLQRHVNGANPLADLGLPNLRREPPSFHALLMRTSPWHRHRR